MNVIPDNAQHIGLRDQQQDSFGFSDTEAASFVEHAGILAVVADGMGGMELGQQAGVAARRTMILAYGDKTASETIPVALSRALSAASAAVCELARESGLESLVGTTLVAAVVHRQDLHWIAVGDSRIYLYRQRRLTQLTTDHVYARHLAEQVSQGTLGYEAAMRDPQRQALTSYLGRAALEEIDRTLKPFPLRPGDRILLCSDGLHGTLSDGEIEEVLATSQQGRAAQALVDAVMARGAAHQDNVTVAILDVPAAEGVPPVNGRAENPIQQRRSRRPRLIVAWAVLGVAVLVLAAFLFTEGDWRRLPYLGGSGEREGTDTTVVVGEPEPMTPGQGEREPHVSPAPTGDEASEQERDEEPEGEPNLQVNEEPDS